MHYKKGKFPFWKLRSKNISSRDKVFLIRAGIHGEEISGPLTILNNVNRIFDRAHKKGWKLIIYPLDNPSGFELEKRYNIDNDKGEYGNNNYLRYLLPRGRWTDALKEGETYEKWSWSLPRAKHLPLETKLSQKLLKKDPLKQVVAFLDLHQDYLSSKLGPLAYQYSYGNTIIYAKIIKKIEQFLLLAKRRKISDGYELSGDAGALKSDNLGFLERHDGSLGDLMFHLGVEKNITVETSGKTALKTAIKVNLLWIYGLMDLK